MGMLYSPERDLKFDFSQPHTVCEYVIAYRTGTGNPPKGLSDLSGKDIIVIDRDIMHDIVLSGKVKVNPIVADNLEAALDILSNGKGDFLLTPRLPAVYLIDKKQITGIELAKQALHSTEYCFAFSGGNKPLLAKFSEGLKVIEASGEYRQIQEKWLGIDRSQSKAFQVVLNYLARITIPLLLILLFVFIWSWTLRRRVTLKTMELQHSEARFRSLVEGAATGIFVLSEGKIVYLNDEASRIFGAKSQLQLLNQSVSELLDDSSRGDLLQRISVMLHENKAQPAVEIHVKRFDGSLLPVEATFAPIHYHGIDCVLVFANDISSRKAAEAELRRLSAAVKQAGDVILITDADAVIQYANPALESMTGFSPDGVIGSKASIFKSGRHDRQFYEELWHTISSGQTWAGRMINKRKDGSLIDEEVTISPIFDTGRIISYVAVKHDLTETLRLNAQLQQAQKMEAIGQLAGGVAHDYNNMLGVILGYADMAIGLIGPEMLLLREYLEEIHKAAVRSADVTRQLLAFARKQTISPCILNLNDTVDGMLRMLRRLIGESVELLWIPGSGMLVVKMDPTQISQILANLCVNARDAITGAGKITIETDSVCFDETYCAEHSGYMSGEFVQLSVSDNGCGISEEAKEKIFEPFFTTKETGQGTGLGLATVFGIVKQNHGFINVYSEPGQGTTFKMYLPKHCKQTDQPMKAEVADRGGHGETILIVEDDSAILKLASKILTRFGYLVIETHCPAEAIEQSEDKSQKIDLLLTDVVMPGMNGRELFEKLQSVRPGLGCLYMSGYTVNVIAQHGVLKEGINFVAKPFSRDELLQAVREALSTERPPVLNQ